MYICITRIYTLRFIRTEHNFVLFHHLHLFDLLLLLLLLLHIIVVIAINIVTVYCCYTNNLFCKLIWIIFYVSRWHSEGNGIIQWMFGEEEGRFGRGSSQHHVDTEKIGKATITIRCHLLGSDRLRATTFLLLKYI